MWYGRSVASRMLAPVSWLYCLVAVLRRLAYESGLAAPSRLPVPVIVVGNITVGGSGKTPLVIWISRFLRQAGFTPGIVTRGYGGRARHWPQQVRADSDPRAVGDEPVLLARRSGCPVAAAPARVDAARGLLAHSRCDIIVADDGLQHYALGRDIEIAVIDGQRRLGSGRCLPAGPLREPAGRLRYVDLVVASGTSRRGEFAMAYLPGAPRSLRDETRQRSFEAFTGDPVHAVAGIGNPGRFFSQLRRLGLTVVEHPFPDHHAYAPEDLDFGDSRPVLMTEKDAVKCTSFALEHHWYIPIEADLPPHFGGRLLTLLQRNSHGQESA